MDITIYQDLAIKHGFDLNETLVFSLFKWFNNPLQFDEITSYLKVISEKNTMLGLQSLILKGFISREENSFYYLIKK